MKRSQGVSLPVLYAVLAALVVFALAFFLWGSSLSGFSVMTGQTIAENTLSEQKTPLQCTDSDGRETTQTAGSVTLTFLDGTSEFYTDICEGTATIDYACDGTNVLKERFSPSDCTCQKGACVQCSASECNPSNSQQICSNGRWIVCPTDQVCTLGRCETPIQIPRVLGGSSYVESGGKEVVSSSPAVAQPQETLIPLGTLTYTTTQDLATNERIVFTISGTEYTLKPAEITSTQATIFWKYTSESAYRTFTLSVGDETIIDTFSLKLKSINTITNKIRILITPPTS